MTLYLTDRHETLRPIPWDPERLENYSRFILEETLNQYSAKTYWPVHDLDVDSEEKPQMGFHDFYYGAAGNFWLLHHLRFSVDAYHDFFSTLSFDKDENSSLFVDRIGFLLFNVKLRPTKENTETLLEALSRLQTNNKNEILFGAPSTLIIAYQAYKLTRDPRFLECAKKIKIIVMKEWIYDDEKKCHLWTQHFSTPQRYFGAAHGIAGNLQVLFHAKEILTKDELGLLHERSITAFEKLVLENQQCANWPVSAHNEKLLLHWCHGSPGIICALADHLIQDKRVNELFNKAGELIWQAGPLKKGTSLCHGTSGNAMAFLKLYQRTKNSMWLERAKAFAMHCLDQCEDMRNSYGNLRFSLWTGDLGLVWLNHQIKNQTAELPFLDTY